MNKLSSTFVCSARSCERERVCVHTQRECMLLLNSRNFSFHFGKTTRIRYIRHDHNCRSLCPKPERQTTNAHCRIYTYIYIFIQCSYSYCKRISAEDSADKDEWHIERNSYTYIWIFSARLESAISPENVCTRIGLGDTIGVMAVK